MVVHIKDWQRHHPSCALSVRVQGKVTTDSHARNVWFAREMPWSGVPTGYKMHPKQILSKIGQKGKYNSKRMAGSSAKTVLCMLDDPYLLEYHRATPT